MSRVDTGSWLLGASSAPSRGIHDARVDLRSERSRVFAERKRLLDDLEERVDELLEDAPPVTVDT
jgi:hypothetical protein